MQYLFCVFVGSFAVLVWELIAHWHSRNTSTVRDRIVETTSKNEPKTTVGLNGINGIISKELETAIKILLPKIEALQIDPPPKKQNYDCSKDCWK
jgi:hypothetical protein